MKPIISILILCAFISCTTRKYSTVTVPETHTEFINKDYRDTLILMDSIVIHDSVYIKEKGDTLYRYDTKTEYKYKTIYKYVTKTDTIIKKDSIPYIVTVTEYKEVYKQNWWQKSFMYIGIGALLLIIIIVGYERLKISLKK